MRTDTRTLITSAGLISIGFVIFELGVGWTLLGHWNGRGIINNTAETIGVFLVGWIMAFVATFVAGIFFVANPSRALARQVLVISAAIAAIPFLLVSFAALLKGLTWDSAPKTPMIIVLYGGLHMIIWGMYGAFHGYPDYHQQST